MPNTFVMRTSALQDGTVLRSADVFSPGTDLHGTMVRPAEISLRRLGNSVLNSQSQVRRIDTSTTAQGSARRLANRTVRTDGMAIRHKDSAETAQSKPIRKVTKVLPVEEGVRNES